MNDTLWSLQSLAQRVNGPEGSATKQTTGSRVLVMTLALAPGGASAAMPATARDLCHRVQQTSRARAHQDYAAIKSWVGPGFVHIDDHGRVMRKREWLGWVRRQHDVRMGVITRIILTRNLTSTAVVTCEDSIWGERRGFAKSSTHYVMTTVWHRFGGQWKEASYPTSPLPRQAHGQVGAQRECRVRLTGPAPEVNGHAVPDRVPYVHVEACTYEDISG